MQHKFVRADDSVITAVKSVRYTQQAIDNKCIRLGNCFSSCIEVTAYGTGSAIVANGEEIRYYKVYDVDSSFNPIDPPREEYIGTFTAISSIPTKNTFSFVAYDNVYKLSVDFSQHLASIQSSFPMLISDLLAEIETVSGVQFGLSGNEWWTQYSVSVDYFYADGVTCRDIVSAIYELSGYNIAVNNSGEIIGKTFGNTNSAPGWLACKKYIVCPTDQITYYEDINQTVPLIPAFYKENGINISDYEAKEPSKVVFKKSDGTILKEASPVYPPLYTNEYIVSGNIILDNIIIDANADTALGWCCSNVLSQLSKITSGVSSSVYFNVRNAEAHLFPFRNPYSCFMIAYVRDAQGVAFQFPIMKMVETDSEVVLYSYTNEYFDNSAQNYNSTDQNVVALSALVNKIGGDIDDINNDIGTINGDITTVNTALGNLSYKMYYAVTQLGLTTGSATVSSCWNAMPTQSILIAGVGNFSSSAVPYASAYGQVVIVKNTNTNGYIYLHGLSESVGDYRMYLSGSPYAPSETWIPCGFDRYVTDTAVVFDDITVNANNYSDQTPSVSKTGYKVIGVIGCRVQNASHGGTNGQYCVVAGTWVNSDTTIGVRVKNTTSSAAKVKCTATVLYQKV